ncbi:hypothetical protein CCP3SC1AL1_1870006 [Gammaproteobacteria bacterium]
MCVAYSCIRPQVSIPAGIVVTIISVSVWANQKLAIQEGLWEAKSEFLIQGFPIAMKPRVDTHCVTAKELEDPAKTVSQVTQGRCEVSNFQITRTTATWSATCLGKVPMSGAGQATYDRTHYQGSMQVSVKTPAGAVEKKGIPIELGIKFSGKKLGPC